MKMAYEKPMMDVEVFVANEYVAACGDSGKIYKFECNAPGGVAYYYPDSDGNMDGIYQGSGRARYLGGYNPCHDKHNAPVSSEFYEGFIDRDGNGKCDRGEEAIIWREKIYGIPIDYHATENLDIHNWETAKS